MKRMIGFALFCIAAGIGIMMLLPSKFAGVMVILVCVLVGYQMFCC